MLTPHSVPYRFLSYTSKLKQILHSIYSQQRQRAPSNLEKSHFFICKNKVHRGHHRLIFALFSHTWNHITINQSLQLRHKTNCRYFMLNSTQHSTWILTHVIFMYLVYAHFEIVLEMRWDCKQFRWSCNDWLYSSSFLYTHIYTHLHTYSHFLILILIVCPLNQLLFDEISVLVLEHARTFVGILLLDFYRCLLPDMICTLFSVCSFLAAKIKTRLLHHYASGTVLRHSDGPSTSSFILYWILWADEYVWWITWMCDLL